MMALDVSGSAVRWPEEPVARGERRGKWPRTREWENDVGVKKTGKGRRKLGRKKRRMRSKIRHRKG
jgi:hypothetical protein